LVEKDETEMLDEQYDTFNDEDLRRKELYQSESDDDEDGSND
jgi:hypothetical protein